MDFEMYSNNQPFRLKRRGRERLRARAAFWVNPSPRSSSAPARAKLSKVCLECGIQVLTQALLVCYQRQALLWYFLK